MAARPDVTPERAALEARWLDLTRRALPEAAGPHWPVRFDHCFQRILLDAATGGVWYDAIEGRPAYRHAPDGVLTRAAQIGEDILAGRADLKSLNDASLDWRRSAGRRGRADRVNRGGASRSTRRTSPG